MCAMPGPFAQGHALLRAVAPCSDCTQLSCILQIIFFQRQQTFTPTSEIRVNCGAPTAGNSAASSLDGILARWFACMETIQPMVAHDEAAQETRECIRQLVSVIRRSSTGGSPVDADQVEHIQKVIRVLSLSEEQVSSMRLEERAQVLKIRSNALGKMRLANIVRLSVNSSDGGSSTCSSPTLGASPLSMSPPGSSSYGSPFPYRSPSSAPTAIPMQVPLTMPTCKLKVQQLPLAVPQLGSCASSSAHLAAL